MNPVIFTTAHVHNTAEAIAFVVGAVIASLAYNAAKRYIKARLIR